MAEQMTGGCACGRVRYTATIDDRRRLSLPLPDVPAGDRLGLDRLQEREAGRRRAGSGEPDWYDSSPIAERPYCRECGTSLGFRFKEGSENMDLTVASFDDPSRFVPKHHFGAESMHRAWLNTEGLTEKRTDEYQTLVDKWVEATGSFPDERGRGSLLDRVRRRRARLSRARAGPARRSCSTACSPTPT